MAMDESRLLNHTNLHILEADRRGKKPFAYTK